MEAGRTTRPVKNHWKCFPKPLWAGGEGCPVPGILRLAHRQYLLYEHVYPHPGNLISKINKLETHDGICPLPGHLNLCKRSRQLFRLRLVNGLPAGGDVMSTSERTIIYSLAPTGHQVTMYSFPVLRHPKLRNG